MFQPSFGSKNPGASQYDFAPKVTSFFNTFPIYLP